MTNDWSDLLDGSLMSDGNLTIPGQCHSPRYQQTCKEPTFLQWVAFWLPTQSRISGPHPSGKHVYWLLSTRTDPLYLPIHRHWYPEGKKRLPPDLQVTPNLLLTEYLGDGFLLADAEKKAQRIELGTYGFDREALQGFVQKLAGHKLPFRLKPNNSLYLRGGAVKTFLDFVGPCPVPVLSYNWNAIAVSDLPWRRIVLVEKVETKGRPGGAVKVTLGCGHWFRRPASRVRSGRTNLTVCSSCGNAPGCS